MAEDKKHEAENTPVAQPPKPMGVGALFTAGLPASPPGEATMPAPIEEPTPSPPAAETVPVPPAGDAVPSPPESSAVGLASLASEAAAMEPLAEELPSPPGSSAVQPPADESGVIQPAAPADEDSATPISPSPEEGSQPPMPADIAVPPGGEAVPTTPAVPGGEIDLSTAQPGAAPTFDGGAAGTAVSPSAGESGGGTTSEVSTPVSLSIMPGSSLGTGVPGPDEGLTIVLPKPTPLTDTQRQRLLNSLDAETVKSLRERIRTLNQSVGTALSSRPKLARQAFDALRQAQETLFAAPERIADSEYITNQVEMVVNNIKQSQAWGRYWGPRIFLYEMTWFAGFVALFLITVIWAQSINAWLRLWWGTEQAVGSLFLVPLLNTAVWGGIGGVVGALYSLWWHVSDQQDFTPQYNLWYWTQPLMGFILGAVIFLIIGSGFLAVQGSFASTSDVLQYFPALIAVLGGFRQKFVYELFDRIMQAVTPQIKEKAK